MNIVESIARNLDDLVTKGQVASFTGSTIDAAALIYPVTNQLQGYDSYFYEGSGLGQRRTITAFDPTNKRMTFSPALDTAPSTNTKFLVLKKFKYDDYANALDQVVGVVKMQYLTEKVATMEIVASQYEYIVPSGFAFIENIRLVPSGNTDYANDDEVDRIFEIPNHYWHIEGNVGGTRLIVFDSRYIHIDNIDDEICRVIGQARADITYSMSENFPDKVNEYIKCKTSALLAVRRIREGNEWKDKFAIYQDLAQKYEPYLKSRIRGKPV